MEIQIYVPTKDRPLLDKIVKLIDAVLDAFDIGTKQGAIISYVEAEDDGEEKS